MNETTELTSELLVAEPLRLPPLQLNLDQYLGLWAVECDRFLALLDHTRNMDISAHVRTYSEEDIPLWSSVEWKGAGGGSLNIGTVDILGTMTKRGSSLSGAIGTIKMRRTIRQLAADPDVDGILMRVDSPGGTVSGTADLAMDVKRASDAKPVFAYIEDLSASAAYWVTSQADRVIVNNRTAVVGSIGTYMALYDYSQKAENDGIRAVVIKSGEFKATGFPGTPITDEQMEYFQGIVDRTQTEFTMGVAKGRSLDYRAADELADGQMHMAVKARELGLIDGIQSYEETLDELADTILARRASETVTIPSMEDETVKLSELKAACPGADADFLLAQMEAEDATLDTAKAAWTERRIEAAEKRAAEAEAKAKAAEESGNEAVGAGEQSDVGADDIQAFQDKVDALKAKGMNGQRAVSVAAKQNREAHRRYIQAVNANARRPIPVDYA